jgi:hypothetical protein
MMEQYLPKKQQLDQHLVHYCIWFWRIVLVGFVVMILGSYFLRTEMFFGVLWGPLAMYALWNLLVSVLIGIGIRLV